MQPTARPAPWLPAMLLAFIVPVIFVLIFFRLAANTFHLLGLSQQGAFFLIFASVIGAMINIPLSRKKIVLADPAMAQMSPMQQQIYKMVHYYPPAVTEQVIAINVGGAIIPIVFSAYLLTLKTTSLLAAVLGIVVVAAVAFMLARPMPGVGITLPGFVPPLVAALAAFLLTSAFGGAAPPVAYIAGTLGTLIGADLINLPAVARGGLLKAGPAQMLGGANDGRKAHPQILSIGGAGVFDGIFLTGVIAPLLA